MFSTLGGGSLAPDVACDRVGSGEGRNPAGDRGKVSDFLLMHVSKFMAKIKRGLLTLIPLANPSVSSKGSGRSALASSLAISRPAGKDSISGSTSPGPTSGTFSNLQMNLVNPDGRLEVISIHPDLASARMVTIALPFTQDFSLIAGSDEVWFAVVGFMMISLSTEFAGRGSALA